MHLKWFRSHRRSSTDEAIRSSTETMAPKQKTKRNKSVTLRSRRSHSHGSGLRAMVGLDEERSCNTTPAGSPLPMYATSPGHTHSKHFGLASGRISHGRSPHTQQIPLSPNSHPSIIFIDCPP
ncbi:Hypothetical protein PHPALM_3311 [Phytophthora palmivora]|uniref:Uncharacterized protein n=1 Tax=Phytophthora palmivora TaxID=4796 RepID=A0A2P4YMQ0_9STRA|nr:Hypothetical protein PHPALM_3311 [Phytophthora palmivora]